MACKTCEKELTDQTVLRICGQTFCSEDCILKWAELHDRVEEAQREIDEPVLSW